MSFWLLDCCGFWEGWDPVNLFNHTSWVAIVTPTDRPKSVRNRCFIEDFGGGFLLMSAYQPSLFIGGIIVTPVQDRSGWRNNPYVMVYSLTSLRILLHLSTSTSSLSPLPDISGLSVMFKCKESKIEVPRNDRNLKSRKLDKDRNHLSQELNWCKNKFQMGQYYVFLEVSVLSWHIIHVQNIRWKPRGMWKSDF